MLFTILLLKSILWSQKSLAMAFISNFDMAFFVITFFNNPQPVSPTHDKLQSFQLIINTITYIIITIINVTIATYTPISFNIYTNTNPDIITTIKLINIILINIITITLVTVLLLLYHLLWQSFPLID